MDPDEPMAGRGARADEYLAAMRSLWEDEAPAFSGQYVEFEGVDGHPRPLDISVSPARPLDEAVVEAYAELGVQRLIVVPRPNLPLGELLRFVELNAPSVVGAATAPG